MINESPIVFDDIRPSPAKARARRTDCRESPLYAFTPAGDGKTKPKTLWQRIKRALHPLQ